MSSGKGANGIGAGMEASAGLRGIGCGGDAGFAGAAGAGCGSGAGEGAGGVMGGALISAGSGGADRGGATVLGGAASTMTITGCGATDSPGLCRTDSRMSAAAAAWSVTEPASGTAMRRGTGATGRKRARSPAHGKTVASGLDR